MPRSETTSPGVAIAALALCLLALALALATINTVTARGAETYGEITRFKGKGTNAGKLGSEFLFAGEEAHAFAVDPESGRIFVGSESGNESEKLRVQSYGKAGAYEAEGLIKPPALPAGTTSLEPYEGFALDPKEGRLYVLASFKRFVEDPIDGNFNAAGALYALNSTPSVSGKLEAAAGTGKEGLLGTTESLGANSNVQGKTLLEPSGIAVDPLTHEILILGLVDAGAGALHVAVEHVSSTGSVLFTWVDPNVTTRNEEPDSPVVSPGGTLFFETRNELFALPADATSGAPEEVFVFAEPGTLNTGPFVEEITSFGGNEAHYGGSLAVVAEGAGGSSGRLVVDGELAEMNELGQLGESRNSVLDLSYSETAGHVSVSELGWTGGVPGEGSGEKLKPCEIGFQYGYPQVAGASSNALYVLSPAWGEVIEFGPGGSGCPTAKIAPTGLELSLDGHHLGNPELSDTVTLSADVVQAGVLGVQWIFGDGQQAETSTPAGEQTEMAETTHKFAKAGKLTVEATIHTDDLATPVLHVSGTVTVTGTEPGAPEVSKQPTGMTLLEGETAHFEAAATGEPTPTVQWEVSTDAGVEWKPLSGQTGDTLTVPGVSAAQNGYEYRATFSNGIGTPASTRAAKLSVETRKQREEEAARRKAAEEEAARHKLEEEAAARKSQEEAAAHKSQEEAARQAQEQAQASRNQAEEQSKHGVAGYREGAASVTLGSTTLPTAKSGAVVLELRCPAGVKECTGTVTLRTASAAKKGVVTLAQGSFSVAGGTVKAVTLHLSARARKLLAHSGSLRTRFVLNVHNASGEASAVQGNATLRLSKHR